MQDTEINILIADDNRELCITVEHNLINSIKKFKVDENIVKINKAFTAHAYEHGCNAIKNGFKPTICIFDLVFNGTTGIELYQFINEYLNYHPYLCIYTGVEKTYEKREEAEILASELQDKVNILAKPNILKLLEWFEKILENNLKLDRKYEKDDPFDLL